LAAWRRDKRIGSDEGEFHVSQLRFILSVLSLTVMGQAVKARAADSCQPVYNALTKLIALRSLFRKARPLEAYLV
jgi:hypothetical protein